MAAESNLTGVHTVADGRLNAAGTRRAVVFGTLIAGTMDITAACLTWLFRGVPASRVLQSVASGLLGRDAYSGGASSAVLGLLLHFMVMSVIVAVYVAVSSRLSALARHAVACGAAYGIAVYAVMTFIVVPASAAPVGRPELHMILVGVIVHILCVGVPIALITRRFTSLAS